MTTIQIVLLIILFIQFDKYIHHEVYIKLDNASHNNRCYRELWGTSIWKNFNECDFLISEQVSSLLEIWITKSNILYKP